MKLIGAEVIMSKFGSRLNGPKVDPLEPTIWVQVPDGFEVGNDEVTIDEETGFVYYKGDPVYYIDSVMNSSYLEPVISNDGPRRKMIGGMKGGAYACSSDSRFPFSNAIRLHDRYETQEMYDALSR